MVIAVDGRIPNEALSALSDYGKIILISSTGIVYPAISGHPDIFLCKVGEHLFVAPNTPKNIKQPLTDFNIQFSEGEKNVGESYPETAHYNAVVTDRFVLHNSEIIDISLRAHCENLEFIEVKQAYSRCNTLALKNDRFITSDKGIEKALLKRELDVLYVDPQGIVLPGFEYGFFGGCCGVSKTQVFIIGNLDHYPEGKKVRDFLFSYEIVELYDGPLFDGGGLVIFE